jgi:putative ABC transport system ATP-binding protein
MMLHHKAVKDVAVQLINVSKSFPQVYAPVLDRITFSVRQGEFCVIIGPNGSGKSTLLKIISQQLLPSQGRVFLPQSACQVVQDVEKGLIPSMTLLENVVLSRLKALKPCLKFYDRYRSEVVKDVQKLNMKLEKFMDQPLIGLSGGQKQMISTFMALNSGKELVLLDEHTSALDPVMQKIVMDYTVKCILENNMTAIMITHKLEDALLYGNRLVMLQEGRIVLDVKGDQKQALTLDQLITLFHSYQADEEI